MFQNWSVCLSVCLSVCIEILVVRSMLPSRAPPRPAPIARSLEGARDQPGRAAESHPPGAMDAYVELQTIGRGSQGTVCTVRHVAEGAIYLMKRIHVVEHQARRAALREAQYLQLLQHTAVVAYRDCFIHEDSLCIVMEYCAVLTRTSRGLRAVRTGYAYRPPLRAVRTRGTGQLAPRAYRTYRVPWHHRYCAGADLARRISMAREPFTEEQILQWLVQLALALHHVHERGILHRDLKAQNVFITSTGLLKLGDFGISKVRA
jgi:NIMA (never in mitosis gene a)-related kinase